jgi:transposase
MVKSDIKGSMEKEKINAIKMTPDEQYFLRKMIVKLHVKGYVAMDISNMLDINLRHTHKTIKKYKDGGWEAISLKTMGRPRGSNKTLTSEQEEAIKETLTTKNPDAYGLNGFLWDMRNVLMLVLILFNIKIPRSSMAVYFSRWGFTPQRPVIKNYKQNPEHVRQWLEVEYPKIKARAKEENAEIYWGDEVGIQNKCNYARGYAPKGQTPSARVSSDKKIRINMVSAVNNQGKLLFMTYEGKMNQARLIDFMKRLIKSNDRKVFLILDNLNVHHGKIAKTWVAKNKDRIEVFYLPSYSPDLNPDEYFNGVLKREIENRGNANTKERLIKNVRASARKIQANERLICSLFEAGDVNYAA